MPTSHLSQILQKCELCALGITFLCFFESYVKLEYVSNTFSHIYKESKKGQIETASGL